MILPVVVKTDVVVRSGVVVTTPTFSVVCVVPVAKEI